MGYSSIYRCMSKVMQKSNIQSDKKDTLPAMVSWYVPEKILRNGKWQIEIEVMARKASQWLSWKKALKLRENQTENQDQGVGK